MLTVSGHEIDYSMGIKKYVTSIIFQEHSLYRKLPTPLKITTTSKQRSSMVDYLSKRISYLKLFSIQYNS